ncbi:hypothetical protein [Streptomyces uncialis]|uniref:hypothetical protein n=1 Tax=Streptomyces uncialis TaxID=1048205 RepID=UPI00386505EE
MELELRHDRTELYTRAVQPVLWLLIFGETFSRVHAIPTGRVPYLGFLAPGVIAQSAMFIAICSSPRPRGPRWSPARRSRRSRAPSAPPP